MELEFILTWDSLGADKNEYSCLETWLAGVQGVSGLPVSLGDRPVLCKSTFKHIRDGGPRRAGLWTVPNNCSNRHGEWVYRVEIGI